jgi:hypothetical protein
MVSTTGPTVAEGKRRPGVRLITIFLLTSFGFALLQSQRISVLAFLRLDFGVPDYIDILVNFVVCVVGAFSIESLNSTRLLQRSVESSATSPDLYLQSDDTVETPDVHAYRLVSSNLNTRVNNLQKRATAIYWTILLIIGTGVWIIIFSGYLSSWDTLGAAIWDRIDSEASVLNRSIERQAASFYDSQRRTSSDKGNQSIEDNKQFNLSSDIIVQLQKIVEHRGAMITASIDDMKARTANGQNWNLSGTILRICIISLIIFLVQILIQLYRYNSRLIAFYSSRRDALLLARGELREGRAFAELLIPTGLDFGREPNHPLYEAARFLSRGRGARDKGASTKPPAC